MLDAYNEIPEELEDECWFCGSECDGKYCSRDCRNAYEAEN
jgi:hypothetical protein